jgi:SH3-like domain-containing protein
MKYKFWIFHFPGLLTLIGFITLLTVATATQLLAQSADPVSLPAPAANELVVVAGGRGATLYTAAGTLLVNAPAGERLIAAGRSADDQWLLVRTAADETGWAPRAALIIFERLALPVEAVDVTLLVAGASAVGPAPSITVDAAVTATDAVTTTVTPMVAMTTTDTAQTGLTTETTIQALVRTGSARLNVRSGPATTYPVVDQVAAGATLTVRARNVEQSWLQVARPDLAGGFGWVATQFVAVTDPLTALPVVEAVNGDAAALAGQPSSLPSSQASEAPGDSTVAPPISAQPTGLRGKLVFLDRNGGDIYLYTLGSGALQRLTSGFDPALSPDGTQVAFSRGGGDNGIYLINVDGSNERKIFGERELLRAPKWSPDGQWLVFSRGDEFNKCYLDEDTGECLRSTPFFTDGLATGKDHIRKLARIDLNGENYRDLAVVPEAFAPDWSSAGVVYQSAAGLQITQDTPEDNNRLLYFEIRRQYHQDPDWQSGGRRIVFQQRQGSHYEIFGINPDGSGLSGLTRPATALVDQMPSNVSPAWSPDGQSIVFLSNRTADHEAGPWRLWVMNADGSNQRPLPVNVPLHYDYVLEQMVDWGP